MDSQDINDCPVRLNDFYSSIVIIRLTVADVEVGDTDL